MTKKSIEVNDSSTAQYSVHKNMGFKTPILRSDWCGYSDAYVNVKWIVTFKGTENANRRRKKLTFENNARFTSRISKIKNTSINYAEDVNNVMPMYNQLDYIDSYSMTWESLWNLYRDEVNDDANENKDVDNNRTNNNKATTSKYFE